MPKKAHAKTKAAKGPAGAGRARPGFSLPEKEMLLAKGLSPDQLARLIECGVRGKDDLKLVGDSATLSELARIPAAVAERVMSWALGTGKTLRELIFSGEYIPWEDMHIRE